MRIRRMIALAMCVSMATGATALPSRAAVVGSRPTSPHGAGTGRGWSPDLDPTAHRAPTAQRPVSGECDQPTVTDARGDNRRVDILSSTLTSDCSSWTLTTRLAKPVDLTRLAVWEMHIDTQIQAHGCQGADYFVLTFVEQVSLASYLVDVPDCDPDNWVTRERASVTQPDRRTLQVTFRGASLGHPGRPRWSNLIVARGATSYDAAPDSGWRPVYLPPGMPQEPRVTVGATRADVTWGYASSPGERTLTYRLTLSKNGGPPVRVRWTPRIPDQPTQRFSGLEPGATYVVTITASNGPKSGPPAVVQFTVPGVAAP